MTRPKFSRLNITDRLIDEAGRPTSAFLRFLNETLADHRAIITALQARVEELETRLEALEP